MAFLAELANGALGDDPIGWPRLKDPARVRELFARTKPGYVLIAEIDASLTPHRGVTVQGEDRFKCTESVLDGCHQRRAPLGRSMP